MPPPLPSTDPARVRFGQRGAFSSDLKQRVDAYFDGRERRDLPGMYLKSAIILTWFTGSWALLVFAAQNGWQAALCAVSLGLSIAAVGMGVQHDANHGGYSKRAWVNRAFGQTLDVMGVCSFIWRQKHNIIHHTFTNIQGVDFDLDFGKIARLSPEQPLRARHRYQHLYLWFLYGFLLPKWVFYDDFVIYFGKEMGPHRLPRLNLTEKALFVGYKLFFVGWAIVIPALFHPLWQVLVFHLVAVYTLGITLAAAFQLAHCVEEADFPAPAPDGETTHEDWAAHQVETTVDFAPKSAVLRWFLGGLNFQVEHHLFPKVCHLHYLALSGIVEEVATKHGIHYRRNLTLRGALASHFRHLKKLGRPAVLPTAAIIPPLGGEATG
jgi:linoleoyl-CoA desaturase